MELETIPIKAKKPYKREIGLTKRNYLWHPLVNQDGLLWYSNGRIVDSSPPPYSGWDKYSSGLFPWGSSPKEWPALADIMPTGMWEFAVPYKIVHNDAQSLVALIAEFHAAGFHIVFIDYVNYRYFRWKYPLCDFKYCKDVKNRFRQLVGVFECDRLIGMSAVVIPNDEILNAIKKELRL